MRARFFSCDWFCRDLCGDEYHGDVTQLDILLDLLTELIAVLARHGNIAEYEVRFCRTHFLQCRVGIETGDESVVA